MKAKPPCNTVIPVFYTTMLRQFLQSKRRTPPTPLYYFLFGKLPSLSRRFRIISYNPVLARPEIIPPRTTSALIPVCIFIRILTRHPPHNAASGIYLFGNHVKAVFSAKPTHRHIPNVNKFTCSNKYDRFNSILFYLPFQIIDPMVCHLYLLF